MVCRVFSKLKTGLSSCRFKAVSFLGYSIANVKSRMLVEAGLEKPLLYGPLVHTLASDRSLIGHGDVSKPKPSSHSRRRGLVC